MKLERNPMFCFFITLTFALGCKKKPLMIQNTNIEPPLAQKIPYQHKIHNDIRIDDYYWLRERENPEVTEYLERENDYYRKMTAVTKPLKESLFKEMKSRIKEDDNSTPYFYNGYWYILRYEKGKQYPIYTRKKDSLTAPEEILFNCNEMAEGQSYFHLRGVNVSPDNTKVAYGVDLKSRRKYTLYVKDLTTGALLETKIENTTGGSTWAADNKHLFYTYQNPETLRSESIFRHNITTPNQKDVVVYHEEDETFSVSVGDSKSRKYLFIASYSTLTTEYRFLSTEDPLGTFQLVQPRVRGLEYDVSEFDDHFYVMTNKDGATNFKIMKTPVSKPGMEHWEPFLEHREEVLLEDLEIFKDYWVITERTKGLTKLRVSSWDGTQDYYVPVEGETYTLYSGYNPSFETQKLRYVFNSLKTPSSVYDFDMKEKKQDLLKRQEVLDESFDPSNYVEERIWASATDGTKIPVSIVYHKKTKPGSNTPLLQYAYGSYGYTIDPGFSSTRLSLLNRGFVFAIAHVRGGEYMGRPWYEKGKLLDKKNTFFDFIAVSKHLIAEEYTSAEHLHAYGGSAGGLLMGAIVNETPELYNSVIAAVPFVDVITTMLDESIPLTTSEYDEWGNPNDLEYYEYIKSYSPYDNVEKKAYPNMYVTAGFHDSQVQYWEPAKWIAKLRVHNTSNSLLFLDTDMEAGHGGASGRFNALKETAKKYAFLIDLEGISD